MSDYFQLAVELAVDNLVPLYPMDKMKPYKQARLVKSTGGKGWYILFYVWDVQKQDLVRKRKFIPAEYESKADKERYAKRLVLQINKALKEGFHIDRTKKRQIQEEIEKVNSEVTVNDSIDKFYNVCLNIKKNCEKEARAKIFSIKRFQKWLALNRYKVEYISEITPRIARKYFDYLLVEKGLGASTYNNYLSHLRNYYNTAIKREWTTETNPFVGIEQLKSSYGEKNIPFTDEELKKMKEFILKDNPYMWTFISFIYYAFMRPSEIKRLRVRNIDMVKKVIRIEGSQSKVKAYDVIPLAPSLYKQLEEMNLEDYPSSYHLFSAIKEPSDKELGQNWATKYFKKIKEKFDLTENHTIYGFKHTAVCKWYEQEKDIVRIQRMCRHTTIEMTARYLKSLGVLVDQYRIDSLPEI